ncbi:MAG: TIR domain-containing protein [Planctomycetota bacterium]
MADGPWPTAFLSYSHADGAVLDETLPFLEAEEPSARLAVWHDRRIRGGEAWYQEIDARLTSARVAVLFVSERFLRSDFCMREEAPVLVQRHRVGELALLPFLVESCDWQREPWLRRLQMLPREARPLDHPQVDREAALRELARRVRELASGPAVVPSPLAEQPDACFDLARLPETGSLLFGRNDEVARLDRAWDGREGNVVVLTAGGGAGKSTLLRVWCELLAQEGWRGAERAFAWSFYSQGTGRLISADAFVDSALRWFGFEPPAEMSAWDRGERLAELVAERRTLLLLDGVEPVQSSSPADRGCVRDPALNALLDRLAHGHPGLCVVTTREPVTDLARFASPAVEQHDLERISAQAGRALLRSAGVRGEADEVEAAVERLGGHALAVRLLASYVADTPMRRVESLAQRDGDDSEERLPEGLDAHAARMLQAWAARFGAGPELDLLHLLGLFDRPAGGVQLDALARPPAVPDLTSALAGAERAPVLERLRAAGLVAPESRRSDLVDCHPLVREFFGWHLREASPLAWRSGHDRLFEHLLDTSAAEPETRVELEPIYDAIAHGQQAGRTEQAFQVYLERVCQGDRYYATQKLGAHAAELGCLAHFFAGAAFEPHGDLPFGADSLLLHQYGHSLVAIGQPDEAQPLLEQAVRLRIRGNALPQAATSAKKLCELEIARGRLKWAVSAGGVASELARRGGDLSAWVEAAASLAHAVHQSGDPQQALDFYRSAEEAQATIPPYHRQLYSLRGFRFCDLLLELGHTDDVVQRVQQPLEIATRFGPLDTGLALISRAGARLALGDAVGASEDVEHAITALRHAGHREHLPLGLLARAELRRVRGELDPARDDLDEVLSIATRWGVRLHAVDARLELARVHLARENVRLAAPALGQARSSIDDMGYRRREAALAGLEQRLAELRA